MALFETTLKTAAMLAGSALLLWVASPVWAEFYALSTDFASPESPIPGWIQQAEAFLPVLIVLSAIMLMVGAAAARRRAAGGGL